MPENAHKIFSENLCNSIPYPTGNETTRPGDLYPSDNTQGRWYGME